MADQRQPGSRGDPRIERDDRQGLFGASGQLRVHADAAIGRSGLRIDSGRRQRDGSQPGVGYKSGCIRSGRFPVFEGQCDIPVSRGAFAPASDVCRCRQGGGMRTGVADRRNAFVQQSYVARSFGVERSVAEIVRRPYGTGCRFVGKTGERTETVRCGAGRQRCPAGGVPAEPYAASVVLLLGRAGLRIVDLRPQGRSVGLCGLFRE